MIGWMILLFVTGIVLVFAEFFVPGAVCGILGTGLIIGSAILGCYAFPEFTVLIIVIEGGAAVACIAAGFYLIFRTGAGRSLVLHAEMPAEDGWVAAVTDGSLLGTVAEAYTPLRPAGVIVVNGKRHDAVSSGEYVDAGQQVRVIEVRGSRVVVEGISGSGQA